VVLSTMLGRGVLRSDTKDRFRYESMVRSVTALISQYRTSVFWKEEMTVECPLEKLH